MQRKLRSALPIVLGAILGGLVAQQAARAADGPIVVHLQVLRTKHIAVETRINGKGPFRLILDTGAPLTFIDHRIAVLAGLLKADSAKPTGLFGMGGMSTLKTLEVGGALVKEIPVMILDHPIVQMVSDIDGPIDGIVGFSFFARFHTTIDYAASTVSFTPVSYRPPDVIRNVMGRVLDGEAAKKTVSLPALWGMRLESATGGKGIAEGKGVSGVRVTTVFPHSAAAAAGLRPGDRLLILDRRWTDSIPDFYFAAARVQPGQWASLHGERNGKPFECRIRPRLGL